MVGGDETAVERIAPVLATMEANLCRTGPLGSGYPMKALNNFGGAAACALVSAHWPATAAAVDGASDHSAAHKQCWTAEFAVALAEG